MLPAARGTKIIAWCRTVALSFFSSASKIALFQRLSWYWKMSCPITSATRQPVISQATFQLFSEDQKPRAVRQNRRTSGLACSCSTCFLLDFFFLAMKTVVPRRLTVAASTNAAKFQKFTLRCSMPARPEHLWVRHVRYAPDSGVKADLGKPPIWAQKLTLIPSLYESCGQNQRAAA